jgi:hypothetical protein
MPKNGQKRKARPSQSIAKPGDDYDVGLWIDYELLRKDQNHTPAILHDASAATNSRYLSWPILR